MRRTGISCLCLTFGRIALLEEAIESFLRQTWHGPKELLVINDNPNLELFFEHPTVSVFNINRRLRTLGEKRNLSAALAKYDRMAIWDDDDICLPWRLEHTMNRLSSAGFYKAPRVWKLKNGHISSRTRFGENYYHVTAAFGRETFEVVGGYRCLDRGEDLDFEERIRKSDDPRCSYNIDNVSTDLTYYIYRSHQEPRASKVDSIERIPLTGIAGKVYLNPRWERDYIAEVKELISEQHFQP